MTEHLRDIHLLDYDFILPEENIALRPIQPKEKAKLLFIDNNNNFSDWFIHDILNFVKKGDAIVVNETIVVKAYLNAKWMQNGTHRKNIYVNISRIFPETNTLIIFTKRAKLNVGDTLVFTKCDNFLNASVTRKCDDGSYEIICQYKGDDIFKIINALGEMPLPPYITKRRSPDTKDNNDYQTIFAKTPGAVAAPTAGLHFTEALRKKIQQKGVEILPICLHVAAGTFLPLREDIISPKQRLHHETGQIPKNIAKRYNEIKQNGNKIFAIGTTVLRLLESASTPDGILHPFSGQTDIFIKPGQHFNSRVDYLLTNFHLPKSSLFLLVCAFGGSENLKQAYEHAIRNNYRFYSYGDACLIAKKNHNQ